MNQVKSKRASSAASVARSDEQRAAGEARLEINQGHRRRTALGGVVQQGLVAFHPREHREARRRGGVAFGTGIASLGRLCGSRLGFDVDRA